MDDDDPFIKSFDSSELEIASEFLSNWLHFLTKDLCPSCTQTLTHRVNSLRPSTTQHPNLENIEPTGWDSDPTPPTPPTVVRMSWADMAQEDELEAAEEEHEEEHEQEQVKEDRKKKVKLSREERENFRFKNVGRKKDFICLERVRGKIVNILDGLELHTGVFSAAEQKRIVEFVYGLQEKGRSSQFRDHTYMEPTKWMRGKGRVTIQFGCCYNYATDKDGNPPGILRKVAADPIPSLFKVIIKRLVRWHVLPTSCVPDSCIVNIYEAGDCIPPHIDSHDFVRPFCTVSFLSECNIVFGTNLKIEGPGEFSGSTAIPLPLGSVLVLNGNGADVAKHCVPAVPSKRISITFRKMDEAKQPFRFSPEPDLQNIQPLPYDLVAADPQHPDRNKQPEVENKNTKKGKKSWGRVAGDAQYHSYDPQTSPVRPQRQIIDARSARSSDAMIDRQRESFGRSSHSRYRYSQHNQLLPNDADEQVIDARARTSGVVIDGQRESYGRSSRRIRETEHTHLLPNDVDEQAIYARSARSSDVMIDGQRESFRRPSHPRSRDSQSTQSLPNDVGEPTRSPHQEWEHEQEWEGEEGSYFEGARRFSGRRVRLEQKRIVISRNIDAEDKSISTGSHVPDRSQYSGGRMRSQTDGRRRVQTSMSDN